MARTKKKKTFLKKRNSLEAESSALYIYIFHTKHVNWQMTELHLYEITCF